MATLILFFLILTIHLILYSLEFEIAAAVNILLPIHAIYRYEVFIEKLQYISISSIIYLYLIDRRILHKSIFSN